MSATEEIRHTADRLQKLIVAQVPEGYDRAVAITRIDQAIDRVDRAMAIDAGVGQLPDTPTGEPAEAVTDFRR